MQGEGGEISGFWDFDGRIGAVKDSVWRQGCGWFLFNGSRTTISPAAVGFALCSLIWVAEQPYISFLVVKK